MLDILLYSLIALAVIIVILFAYASTRPDTFAIYRSANIAAPPERIFSLIANLRSMNAWSPLPIQSEHQDYLLRPGERHGAAHASLQLPKLEKRQIKITDVER